MPPAADPDRTSPLKSPNAFALAALSVVVMVTAAVIWYLEVRQIAFDRASLGEHAANLGNEVEVEVERALTATYAIAALVRQGDGEVRNFDAVAAEMLPFYPGVDSLQLAPGGVIGHVVPLAGNEAAIGHDLLSDPKRNKEAFLARDSGRLTLAGPFNLVQGGLGAVGRLPVYLDGDDGKQRFWGFAGVLIRFPDAIEKTRLHQLVGLGLDYELSRIHPDTGSKQVIATSTQAALEDPVVRTLQMPNGRWDLAVVKREGWISPLPMAMKLAFGLAFCFMGWSVARQWAELRAHRAGLQRLVDERTAQLEARQAELKKAQAVSRTGSWVVEPPTRALVASTEAQRIYGLDGNRQLAFEDVLARVHDDDREAVREAWRAALRGAAFDIEHRVVVGVETRWVRAQAEVEFATDGAVRRAVGSVQEITDQREAREALLKLQAAVEQSPASIVITDTAGCITYVNPQFERSSGYSEAEVLGRNPRILQPATKSAVDYANLWATLSSGQVWRGEFENRRKDGSTYFESASISPIQALDGTITGYVGVKEDITERRRSEAEMREAMVVFNSSAQGILITDAAGIITSVNPACCEITGYSAEEMLGRTPAMFRSNRHDAAFYEEMWTTLKDTGTWEGEIWNRRRDGELYAQWITISAVRDARGKITKYVSHSSDITFRKQREEVIWRQANFDDLTGLANRHLLNDRMAQTLAQARRHGGRVGVMFLDLDGFKWINDTLGHDFGDELLKQVAERLKDCMREQDTVARLGGDEFTLVTSDIADYASLRQIGDKVLTSLSAPFMLGGSAHHISASIGMTVFPDDGEDRQVLFRNADIAMYEAKQLGKNRCEFYATHMRERARKRVEVEAELRLALERGEFELYYQPIVERASGRMSGAEALLRWNHPQRGLVAPGEFIGIAEDTGLIVPIGAWVLSEAARQIDAWRRAGYPMMRIAVNVSSVQYREADLPDMLKRICDRYNLQRSQLMLEITESVLMLGDRGTESRMREIRDAGMSFALDDFGTGYSSLSYLKRFPVDVVKIDRSFVVDCYKGGSDGRLVEAIIQMAHSLDLTVTAEGVETADQATFLRDNYCDHLQGFMISKPLPAAAFECLFARGSLLDVDEPATATP